MAARTGCVVRAIEPLDLDALVRIDEKLTGEARKDYWRTHLDIAAYRGRGVRQALVDRFVDGGRELRAIQKVATLVDLDQAEVREFFVRRGFRHGPMVQLEHDLDLQP